MTRKEIQRYFDNRPTAEELYTVGSIVFINPGDAAQYATEAGSVVETHLRNDRVIEKIEVIEVIEKVQQVIKTARKKAKK